MENKLNQNSINRLPYDIKSSLLIKLKSISALISIYSLMSRGVGSKKYSLQNLNVFSSFYYFGGILGCGLRSLVVSLPAHRADDLGSNPN